MMPADREGADPAATTVATMRALAALDELSVGVLLLRAVLDDADVVVDFVVEYANDAAEAAAASSAPSILGRRVLEDPPLLAPALVDDLAGVLYSGDPLRIAPDYGAALGRGAPRITGSRLGDGVLVVYDDGEARARTRGVEERYGAVLEATSDWVSIADRDQNLIYVNAGGRRMVGIGLDEDIGGRRLGDFSPRWAREFVRRRALGIARRDGVWRGEGARLHRNGREIPVSQVIVAARGPDGEIDFYATIARDMTRERAAEAALRASEERFRIAFEQAPVGMALTDLEGRYVQVNDAYCRTVGRTREEIVGATPMDITHPEDASDSEHAMRRMLAGELDEYSFEKRYLSSEGETVWAELTVGVFRDESGAPQYLIGMVQGIGERRIAQTLQRSMVTTQLPEVEGVELAVRYLPGARETEVGGDWYDAIPLPGGRVGFVIGDVVGRGIEAAVTMSQLRTALRAYATEGLEPAEVVRKLHRMTDHLGEGLSTTLAYLDLDPGTGEVRYVSAGHLPVLHVAADRTSAYLEGARSTPLGTLGHDARIPQARLVLAPGESLLLYTDGLVERRDDGIVSRLERLRAAVASGPEDLDACLEHVTAEMAGDAVRFDDIAMLKLRYAGSRTAPPS